MPMLRDGKKTTSIHTSPTAGETQGKDNSNISNSKRDTRGESAMQPEKVSNVNEENDSASASSDKENTIPKGSRQKSRSVVPDAANKNDGHQSAHAKGVKADDDDDDDDDAAATPDNNPRVKRERDAEGEDEKKSSSQKRTRKDLEFEWDRSQLRDPRLTPGRELPPCRSEFDMTEEEKALFRGPPPERPKKKGRLNAFDKDAMFQQQVRNNIADSFHELDVCFDKGPNGSPTYDKSGFQLDYKKVADWKKPRAYNKKSMMNSMDRALSRQQSEKEKMCAAFFKDGKGPQGLDNAHYVDQLIKDRVSKDLNIPYHKIGVKEVEQWSGKGFEKQHSFEYERATVTNEEKKRFGSLLEGASLRK